MNRQLFSRIAAAIVLAFVFAIYFGGYDQSKLARIQAMTPQEYYDHAKDLVSVGFAFRLISFAIFSVAYVMCVEALAWVFCRGWRDSRAG